MAWASMKVEGLDKLVAMFKSLEAKTQIEVIKPSLRQAAEHIMYNTQVPVDTGEMLGTMEVNVGTTRNGVTAAIEIGDGPFWDKGKGSYAAAVEYGHTRGHGVTPGVTVAAQPFMRPAFDQNKDEALNIFVRETLLGIERLAAA